jgi:hypothetical protein
MSELSRQGLKRPGPLLESYPSTRSKRDASESEPIDTSPSGPSIPDATKTPDDHDMDEAILKGLVRIGWSPDFSRIIFSTTLLLMIVENSHGLVQPKFLQATNVMDFLQDNPTVVEQLKVAWEKKSFGEIRRHGKINFLDSGIAF